MNRDELSPISWSWDEIEERLSIMHALFGLAMADVCGDCRTFRNGTRPRCVHRRIRRTSTVWQAGWPACGLFEER